MASRSARVERLRSAHGDPAGEGILDVEEVHGLDDRIGFEVREVPPERLAGDAGKEVPGGVQDGRSPKVEGTPSARPPR